VPDEHLVRTERRPAAVQHARHAPDRQLDRRSGSCTNYGMNQSTTVRPQVQAPANSRAGDVARRVYAEFRELRGSPLSIEQATRLFGLDRETCERVLDTLIRKGFLKRDQHGRYCLAEIGV
jgi:hypothetical protein